MINKIPFALPEIGEPEIQAVTDVMRSDWITTGPKVAEFEAALSGFCGVSHTVCLSSATAGMELVLRLFGIGAGDEVITTPYTFAATANVILHTGAKPVFADIKPGDFNIDPAEIERLITDRTKAVISVDFAGLPADYSEIADVIQRKAGLYRPSMNPYQRQSGRPVFISDAAHSLGANYRGKKIGSQADFTVFSFHAVKNLTTAEGGAILYDQSRWDNAVEIRRKLKLLTLHGQSKDALEKLRAGNWFYSIELAGYKYNMTDMSAAMGLTQLARYDSEILVKRKRICEIYHQAFGAQDWALVPPLSDSMRETSYQVYPLRLSVPDEDKRNLIIQKMGEKGIALNVHFIPLPLHPLYNKLGYSIDDYPSARECYRAEMSLPVYSRLSEDDAYTVTQALIDTVKNI
jgi:dTDP-4-amino-4,6-dideoxygalactose transaminase